ncbi:MAG: hypothetical protein ABI441_03735 [Flavobacterium sp.]
MKSKHTSFRRKVQNTQVYLSLGKIQKEIISTQQNLSAIGKSLAFVEKNGIKIWEKVSGNSINNAEIIREIHAKNLEVKF